MRINEKKEIINRLESLLTDYEWKPIKKKLEFYLMNYTTGIQQIVNIKLVLIMVMFQKFAYTMNLISSEN